MKITFVLLAVALLSACASGYSQFYTPVSGATPEAIAELRATTPPAEPLVDRSPTVPDPDVYAQYGYVAIGYSSFNSGRVESEASAIDQARKVQADLVVIINPTYTGTTTSHVPITTPTSSTSYSSGSATAYGSGGSVTVHGSSTTTTYGSSTTYVPISVSRYDYGAVYFIKRSYIFGANWRDLDTSERAAIESNKGVVITVVVKGTPAFDADFLVGDIIREINGVQVSDSEFLNDEVRRLRGKEVELRIIRGKGEIVKRVRLNS